MINQPVIGEDRQKRSESLYRQRAYSFQAALMSLLVINLVFSLTTVLFQVLAF